MSARDAVYAVGTEKADGGREPNRYMPVVTADLRVFFPPLATEEQILHAIDEAVDRVKEQVRQKYEEIPD